MLTVYDSEYIENINNAMLFVLDSENRMFGKSVVIEDGRITEVNTEQKHIKEMPIVGSEVFVDYEKVGTIKPFHMFNSDKEDLVIEISENLFSVFALGTLFLVNNIMFRKPEE